MSPPITSPEEAQRQATNWEKQQSVLQWRTQIEQAQTACATGVESLQITRRKIGPVRSELSTLEHTEQQQAADLIACFQHLRDLLDEVERRRVPLGLEDCRSFLATNQVQ